MKTDLSSTLLDRAKQVLPGGVNSPVRAFSSVGDIPRFIVKAKGARLWDEDGNEYTDYVGSWGPMILGHDHPEILEAVHRTAKEGLSFGAATKIEIEMAELIKELSPCAEMLRMVNSGTEAVMSAIRVARGFTGRNKIIKFEGCYHGHCDSMLVKAGSGAATMGSPSSEGVPAGCAQDTLVAIYNDLYSVKALIEANPNQIAAVIIEPVAANMGVVIPEEGFLKALLKLCHDDGALLIFDEVITGFRLGLGGAQQYFGVIPDMVTYGKIIGGGMPVGAYCGKKEIMEKVSPLGAVYQAGTLAGNPVAMSAGLTQLRLLQKNPCIFSELESMGNLLQDRLNDLIDRTDSPCCVNGIASLSTLFFTPIKPQNFNHASISDTNMYASYFRFMIGKGIYLAPAQFEAVFLSAAHTNEDIEYFLDCTEQFLIKEMKG